MKRPSYREAVKWIALNDDNHWAVARAKLHNITHRLNVGTAILLKEKSITIAELRAATKGGHS